MLASQPAITGLYVALVPVLAYVVMGTSKHLSVGTFTLVYIFNFRAKKDIVNLKIVEPYWFRTQKAQNQHTPN